jgi:hypothetical protein
MGIWTALRCEFPKIAHYAASAGEPNCGIVTTSATIVSIPHVDDLHHHDERRAA